MRSLLMAQGTELQVLNGSPGLLYAPRRDSSDRRHTTPPWALKLLDLLLDPSLTRLGFLVVSLSHEPACVCLLLFALVY